jgi:hypothetical protein
MNPTPASSTPPEVGDPASWGPERRREVVWHDPRPTAMVGLQMSGLDYLRAMSDGKLPTSPIAKLIKVSYMRPVSAGAELLARGWVTKPGRRVSFADAEIKDPDGRIVATASSSCLILSA